MENVDWDRKIEQEARSWGQYLREKSEFELDDVRQDIKPNCARLMEAKE